MNNTSWEDDEYPYGSQRLDLKAKDGADLLKLKVRMFRRCRPTGTEKWVYDCGPITSAPRYATCDEAKRACLEHARRLLTETLEALEAVESQR
jgi:hypothetical protein